MIQLLNPNYLWLLFIIPFIVFFHFYSIKKNNSKSIRFANFDAIARIKGIDIYSKNIYIFIIDIFIVLALVFSFSGVVIFLEKSGSVFSYVIAIDASQSMGASDIYPDRLSAAKTNAELFIDSLDDRTSVGIVYFAGNSYILQDLVFDKELLKRKINSIEIQPVGGTDIYEAVLISSRILKDEENKAIILISDGQITNDINQAIILAKENDVVVHTIGIGTTEGANSSISLTRLDENNLKLLSSQTGGKYFSANSGEELQNVFSSIAEETVKNIPIKLDIYFIILVVLLVAIRLYVSAKNSISI